MTASLVRAAENGMKDLILEVDITNKRAIALYEQLGFKQTKGSISHVCNPENFEVLEDTTYLINLDQLAHTFSPSLSVSLNIR